MQVVQAQFCCPDGQALAQVRGEMLSCLSSCTTGVFGQSPHHCALRHITEGEGEGKEQQVPLGDRRGFRVYPLLYASENARHFAAGESNQQLINICCVFLPCWVKMQRVITLVHLEYMLLLLF